MSYQCAECGTKIGKGTGTDALKHTVTCLNISDGDPVRIAAEHKDKHTEHSRRVASNMDKLLSERRHDEAPTADSD